MNFKMNNINIFKSMITSLGKVGDKTNDTMHMHIDKNGFFIELRAIGGMMSIHVSIPVKVFDEYNFNDNHSIFHIPLYGIDKFLTSSKKNSSIEFILDDVFTIIIRNKKHKKVMDVRLVDGDEYNSRKNYNHNYNTMSYPYKVVMDSDVFVDALSISKFSEGVIKFDNTKNGLFLKVSNESMTQTLSSFIDYSEYEVSFENEMLLMVNDVQTKVKMDDNISVLYDYDVIIILSKLLRGTDFITMYMTNRSPRPLIISYVDNDVITTVAISEVLDRGYSY